MTGKKCGAAGSLPFTRQPEFLLLSLPLIFRVRVFHFVTLLHVNLNVVVACDSCSHWYTSNFTFSIWGTLGDAC